MSLVSQPSTLNILFHVDSGAGQSICSCPDAFLSLRPCAIEIVGVSGSLPVFGIGTAMFVLRTTTDLPVVGLIHDCLLSQGSPFNLLSVSQFQSTIRNTVDFAVGSPHLSVSSPSWRPLAPVLCTTSHALFPLILREGLYSFSAEPIHPSDDRYRTLPRFNLTPVTPISPGTDHCLSVAPVGGAVGPSTESQSSAPRVDIATVSPSTLGHWTCKLFAGATTDHRILAFPLATNSAFDSELRQFCDGFLAPISSPPARQTYDPANPLHMADLSPRFMGIGDERLRRTIEFNRGLLPATGRVPVHPSPKAGSGRARPRASIKARSSTLIERPSARWCSRTPSKLATPSIGTARLLSTIVRVGAMSSPFVPAPRLVGHLVNSAAGILPL